MLLCIMAASPILPFPAPKLFGKVYYSSSISRVRRERRLADGFLTAFSFSTLYFCNLSKESECFAGAEGMSGLCDSTKRTKEKV
jgi:hypothetical protein